MALVVMMGVRWCRRCPLSHSIRCSKGTLISKLINQNCFQIIYQSFKYSIIISHFHFQIQIKSILNHHSIPTYQSTSISQSSLHYHSISTFHSTYITHFSLHFHFSLTTLITRQINTFSHVGGSCLVFIKSTGSYTSGFPPHDVMAIYETFFTHNTNVSS